ncbi:unnamed protein product [Rhodiola kirilowii]
MTWFDPLPMGPDGKTYVKCNKCGKEFQHDSTSGTANLMRHHDTCASSSPHSATRSSTFKHEKFSELIVEAIVKHDLPFSFVEYEGIRTVIDYVSPELRLPCTNTVKSYVTKIYKSEKVKVHELLNRAKGRICLTSDLWNSHTTDGYLALTAHFIDGDWNLQKKILSFCHMPPPHTGNALAEKINSLICNWGIDKNLFSITLDNASANDSFVEKLKTQLNFRGLLLLNGQLFHGRCCAHILNLIVQDGLKAIDVSVIKNGPCVKYIKGSITRKHKFLECVEQVGLMGNRKALRQDVPTRWNSTFLMLDSALYYRQALGHFALFELDFKTCPTSEEWGQIEMIAKFLEEFYEVTSLFSGSKYATSNLFFPKVFKIQHSIREAMMHRDDFMRHMGNEMSAKFQKYWSDYSLTLGIAVVMDPRYKMSFVEWAYIKLRGENSLEVVMFKDTLNSLYEAYVDRWSSQTSSIDHVNEGCSYSQGEDALFQDFDSSYNNATSSSVRNELQSYLYEQRLDRKMELDVLGWWKKEEFRYPILSRLAGDMLMIPVWRVTC